MANIPRGWWNLHLKDREINCTFSVYLRDVDTVRKAIQNPFQNGILHECTVDRTKVMTNLVTLHSKFQKHEFRYWKSFF